MSAKVIALVGQKFNLLTVLERAGTTRNGQAIWLCQCECGGQIKADGYRIRSGGVRSCGCLVRKVLVGNKHHHRHGMSQHPLYPTWRNMLDRCYNPASKFYENYGGRGIKVCDRWHDPRNFIEDMGDRPEGLELDRIDNNGDYEASNCRWSSDKEQNRNTRVNRLITFNGQTKCLGQWAEETGINEGAIRNRIDVLGWSVERALTTPISEDYHRRGLAAHGEK